MKKVLIGLGVVVVVIVGLVMFVGSNLDGIAKAAIESIGTKMLGVDVSVAAVELSLSEGRGSIRGLEVANPPGYSSNPALALGELTLSLDADAGAISLIRVADTTIRAEAKGETSNFDELMSGLVSDAPADESEAVDESGEPISLRIDRIEIEAAVATLMSDDRDEPIDLEIREMVFTDLEGTGEEIASQVFSQVLSEIGGAVKQAMRAAVEEAVDEAVEEKKEEAKKGLLKKLRGN